MENCKVSIKRKQCPKIRRRPGKIWRRSYDVPPPNGESLAMTAARSIPYFEKNIVPHLKAGKMYSSLHMEIH